MSGTWSPSCLSGSNLLGPFAIAISRKCPVPALVPPKSFCGAALNWDNLAFGKVVPATARDSAQLNPAISHFLVTLVTLWLQSAVRWNESLFNERVPSHERVPPRLRPGGGVGQLLWWVNYLLKQSVPTHRPISLHLSRLSPSPVRFGWVMAADESASRPSPGVPSSCRWTTPQGVGSPISWVISLSKIRDPTQPLVIPPSPCRAGCGCRCFERRSRAAGTACPTWLLIKSVLRRTPRSVASTSPNSSLQAKPEAENPEFPCAWKQLLKFLSPKRASCTRANP